MAGKILSPACRPLPQYGIELQPGVVEGSEFTGLLSYDSSVLPEIGGPTLWQIFRPGNDDWELSITVAGQTFSMPIEHDRFSAMIIDAYGDTPGGSTTGDIDGIDTLDLLDPTFDQMMVGGSYYDGNGITEQISLNLLGSSSQIFDTFALPTSLDAADFTVREVEIHKTTNVYTNVYPNNGPTAFYSVVARVDSIRAVPEPPTLALAAILTATAALFLPRRNKP